MLRDPYVDAPDPGVWTAVREAWPVLKGRSDAELTEALAPLKADPEVDLRQL